MSLCIWHPLGDVFTSESHIDFVTIHQVMLALFDKCDKDKTGELDDKQMAALNAHLFYMVPRLGHKSQGLILYTDSY